MTVLNLQTFAPSTLTDDEGLTVALTTLESRLAEPDVHLELVVQDLCSVPGLFEFILSASPCAERLVQGILDAYPADPAQVNTSFTIVLLRRLSSVVFALPPDLFTSEIVRHIGRHKIYVEDSLPVLVLLCSTDFSTCNTTDATPTCAVEEDLEHGEEELPEFILRHKKQKKSKRRNKVNLPTFDTQPFYKLGVKVPLSNAEAYSTASEVAHNLKIILRFYLELIQEPFLAQRLKDAYISVETDATVRPSSPQENRVVETAEPKPSVYPKVQPMKAALYFENADAFGEWRIIIGTDATKKLRELSNGDRKKCAIVVKKIKQLSNGHFSEENQKRLNSPGGVPIFEAKMQRDLRLVYQIDVVPDYDGEVDRQVIKIYGIYTHTQLNRIWDAVGQHLAGRGKEYRRRCIFRNRPVQAGGDVYLPASFPPECVENDAKPIPLVLSDEDKGELHSLVVLGKYVTFSQTFLHSLIANRDVQHVFELTPQERRIVDCETSCYVLGRSGTGKTTTMLFKILGIQWAWEKQTSGMPKPRQIFVTKSSVLAEKVEEYFMSLLESLELAGCSLEEFKRTQTWSTQSRLRGSDDGNRDGIPLKYSALEDSHFPLFVTFDKLAKMVAADVLSGTDPEVQHAARFFDTDDVKARDSFVTYDVFARGYWPHFPQPLTKGLEPWLVFSEFMGIIKGSEKSLSFPDGFLDVETYCCLSERSNPTYANQRRTIYAIFEAYCKLKRDRRHHDVADRTHAILKTLLRGDSFKGQKVDFLYVDEAQDNLFIDALLLRLICRNPEGLFWAGDTAQTISAGSSFRFNDLKAFLYRIEQDQKIHLIQDRSVTDPTMFQLTRNYRSHGGIINCARSVIERITRFWPDAIDILQPEHGGVDGLKPWFFRGSDQDAVQYEQFLFGSSVIDFEFGARQCILVRDRKALEKLRKKIGKICTIMILYDSKGLEFDDVLLYNFFEDSAIDVLRWRVLLNHMEGEAGGKDLPTVRAPSFSRDEDHFAGVCSELKSLYVGITRARQNLWIFDESGKSEPMRMIWTSRNQIQNHTPGMAIPRLAVRSTKAEWESAGYYMFMHKKYSHAMDCFDKASLPLLVAICEAFHLREEARVTVGIAPLRVQQDAFLTAAVAFTAIGKDAPMGKDKLQYYRNAADCYVHAGDDRKAAIEYLSAQDYGRAAKHFRKAGLFDETLEVLHEHSEKIPSELVEELYTVCRLFYCSKQDGNRPHALLFSSYEEELNFLENYGLDYVRALLLESLGRYAEAAELHSLGNRPLDAIRDFLKERGSCDAIRKATKIILDGLWHKCSFATPPKQAARVDREVNELLELASELPPGFLGPLEHDEISMFRAIAQGNLATLRRLSHVFIKERMNEAALLALGHVFGRLPVLKSYNLQEMSCFLQQFWQYIHLLQWVISHETPLLADSIKRLFCIREVSSIEYDLGSGSFLHTSAVNDHNQRQPLTAALSKDDMVAVLRKYLVNYICKLVTKENELCCNAVAFSQCLTFIVYGKCNCSDCPQEHTKPMDLDPKRYNIRIGIHLQQICILQLMYSVNPRLERLTCVLDWLAHLYEAINPQYHIQGSSADLNLSVIPGAYRGIRVMKHWVREALYDLGRRPAAYSLATTLRLTRLLFTFEKSNALHCINQLQLRLHTYDALIPAFVYPDGRQVLEDIVSLFYGTEATCISASLLFLRHILKSSLLVDLSVFCDCLEVIVRNISISWHLWFNPLLNGLVLPRNWLSSGQDFSAKKDVDIPLILDVLDRVQELLMCLQSDTASQLFTLVDTRLTQMLCNVFISRICRALCLLTYNVRNNDLRLKIRSIFDALCRGGPTQRVHYLYRRYLRVRSDECLKVIVEHEADSKLSIGDLVQFLHARRDRLQPLLRSPRIKNIHYTKIIKIPSLLASFVAARSDLRTGAPAPIFRVNHVPLIEKFEDEGKVQQEEVGPVDEVREEPQKPVSIPNEPALIREHEPTKQEIQAASTIQAAYRTYRKHFEAQRRAIGRGLEAKKNEIFITCLRIAHTSGWQRTPYRTLYLGALPCLIVCLDKVLAIAHKSRDKVKDLLSKGNHEHLEEPGKQISMMSSLLEAGRRLRKVIEPNASMHREMDQAKLKQAVLGIKDLIYQLPTLASDDGMRENFDFAYKLVMAGEDVTAWSDARADAPTFVPRVSHVPQAEKVEDEGKVQPEELEARPDETYEELQEPVSVPSEPALIREHEPTERKIEAANTIQAAYRTYRKHREAQARAVGRGLQAQRNAIFIKCLRNSHALGWKRTPYRTLYLWALPRLVVCLDRVHAISHESKNRAKSLFSKESHERLEELGKQMSMMSVLLKEGDRLRKTIEPYADMHKEQDKAKMKKVVLAVKDLIHRLPTSIPDKEIQENFEFAYELVMVEKDQLPKPEKPTLNTEDLE